LADSSDAGNSKIKRTGAVTVNAGACGERLQLHAAFEPEWDDFDIGQQGIGDLAERMGHFSPPQQPGETQPLWPGLRCASNVTPGARERRIESDNAQACFVVFMPFSFL
jgi:hypothetical protein